MDECCEYKMTSISRWKLISIVFLTLNRDLTFVLVVFSKSHR